MSRNEQPEFLAGYGSLGTKSVRGYGECDLTLSRMAYGSHKFWSIAAWTESGAYTGKCMTFRTDHLIALRDILDHINFDEIQD